MRRWFWFTTLLLCFLTQPAAALYRQAPYEVVKDTVANQQILHQLWAQYPQQRVVVLYFFSYGCPWCYQVNEQLSQWEKSKPADVQLVRLPVVFHDTWALYARAFYMLEALGRTSDLHSVLFRTIQEEHRLLVSQEDMRAFFIEQGVEGQDFDRVVNSFSVDHAMGYSSAVMRALHVMEVPMLIVRTDQAMYATSLTQVGADPAHLMTVLDELVSPRAE